MQRLLFHAQPDPWAVGPFVSLAETQPGAGLPGAVPGAAFILPGAVALRISTEEVSALASRTAAKHLGAYVSALPPQNEDTLASDWTKLLERGFTELCVYHFGLLSHKRYAAVCKAVEEVRRSHPIHTGR
jgi:hypothetical protein